jgi:phosphomannomutase
MGFKGYIPERDGLFSGLMFLELLAKSGKKASQLVKELAAEFGSSHYSRIDVRHYGAQEAVELLRKGPPADVDGDRVVKVGTMDGLKLSFGDGSWLLFRASGTEPLLRIYSESPTAAKVKHLLEAGAALAGAPH